MIHRWMRSILYLRFSYFHAPGYTTITIIKKRLAMQGQERVINTLYQSEDPSPTIPTNRMKEAKWKTEEDENGAKLQARYKAFALLLKPASPTPSNTGSPRSFRRDTDNGIKVLPYYEVLQRGGASPMCNQSIACNSHCHIRPRFSIIKSVHLVTNDFV